MLSPRSQQVLFTLPAFRALGAAERKEVGGFFREIALERDDIVYRAGDLADALYLVVSGAVDVLDGDDVVVRHGPGEVFGVAALMAGEPHALTAHVALDAVLLLLPRNALERLLELHPSLHQRVSVLLAQRLKAVVRSARPRRCEIVVLESRDGPAERRALVVALADALERELGQAVAIVTVAPRTRAPRIGRPDRPDALVPAEANEGGALRERVASELADRGSQVSMVLIDVDADLAATDIGRLGDTVLVSIEGEPPAHRANGSQRVIFLCDGRTGARHSLSGHGLVSLPADEPRRARALARLARQLTHRSVGLALGSGAAWGLAHIGVLDVVERAGVPVDFVAGASMGAIIGAHYALGFSPAELETIATRVRDLPGLLRTLPRLLYLAADFNVLRPGLFAGDHFQRVLESLGPIRGRTFADLEIPFRAVATDIGTGSRVELADGHLSDAVRASFSAPWIFSPFRLGDWILIDGGMSDPVPAETVRSMGADLVIGVNVVPPVYPNAQNPLEVLLRAVARLNPLALGNSERLPDSFDVIVRTLQIMQHELGNNRAGEADVLIKPDLRDYWVLEFWSAAGMIAEGRKAAEAALPMIREKLAELRGAAA